MKNNHSFTTLALRSFGFVFVDLTDFTDFIEPTDFLVSSCIDTFATGS